MYAVPLLTNVFESLLLIKAIQDFKKHLSSQLTDHDVESVIYPKYATKGELTEASVNFLEWYDCPLAHLLCKT